MKSVSDSETQYKVNVPQLTTEQFLRTVWPHKLLTNEMLEMRRIRRSDGRTKKAFSSSIEEFLEKAAQYKDEEVYFSIATRFGPESHKRGCYRVAALWCDLDGKTIEEVLDDEFEHKPNVLVNSGGGVHAYWLLKTPVVVRGDEERWASVENRTRWLAKRLGGDRNTCDLSRILRVAGGYYNHKYKPNREVQAFLYDSDTRYRLEQFGEILAPASSVTLNLNGNGKNRLKEIPAKGQQRLKTLGGGRFNDASREDSSLITSMLKMGWSDADVFKTFMESPRGKDAVGRHSEDWVIRTIQKAKEFLAGDKGSEEITVIDSGKEQDDDEIEYGTGVVYGQEVESDEAETEQWRIYSGADAVKGADEAPQWVIESLIAEESGLLCSGLAHSTKSLIWLCAALQASMRVPVWGKFAVSEKVKNVVFIETEDPRRKVMMRLRHFCKGLGIDHPPQNFHLIRPGPFDLVEQGEQKLLQIIKETKADLLVLSTLQGLLGGRNWKEQAEMGPVNEISVKLQGKCALVVITHSPHNEKRAAGTVTQAANYSSLLHVVKHKDEDTGNTFSTIGFDSKEGGEDKFKLDLDIRENEYADRKTTQVWNVVFQGAQKRGRPSKAQGEKEQAQELKEEGKSVREIGKELGLSKSAVQRLFN